MTEQQKQPNWFVRHKILTVILIILVLGVIGSLGNGDKTNTSKTPEATTTQQAKQEPAPKWDVEAAYAKVTDGMTKAQVEEATGKKSDNCVASDSQYASIESCSYGTGFSDKGTISVTYTDGVVSNKLKTNY